jgi:hypothetical protein
MHEQDNLDAARRMDAILWNMRQDYDFSSLSNHDLLITVIGNIWHFCERENIHFDVVLDTALDQLSIVR